MAKRQFGKLVAAPDPVLVALVSQFLSNHGFSSTLRIFNTERQKRPSKRDSKETDGEERTKGFPQLDVIFKQYRDAGTIDAESSSSDEDSHSHSDSSSSDSASHVKPDIKMAEADGRASEHSADSSSTSSDSSSSDASSSSSSDSDSEADKQPPEVNVKSLKRKASSSASESSSSSGSSSEGGSDAPAQKSRPNKKAKLQQDSSDSSSGSSELSSSSEAQSDDEDSKRLDEAAKATLPESDSSDASSDSESSEKSSSESSSSSDEEEDKEEQVALKRPAQKIVTTTITTTAPADSDSSATIQGDAAPLPPWLWNEKKPTGARPTRLAKLSETYDPASGKYISNTYVSYDYANRAYQDLSVTRGKGFTKEKNKKKRGSYRGGTIDTSGGKSFKFED